MHRVFLGFDRPALASAADWLIERAAASPRSMDLSGFLVVLPVASAGRRLEEILVQRAVERSLPLVPPDIVTVGHMPERLYHPAQPIADDATLKLAWAEAIRRTDRAKLAPFFPVLPAEDDIVGWMAAADVIDRLHVELAAERLDFAQVSKRGAKLAAFNEANRWKLLSQIQERWLRRIEELGFNDKHAARRSAIDERRCTTERHMVLVATVDLNEVHRAMIDQVAAKTTALVFAPQAWADRFDPLGCVICKPWCSASMELSDDQIEQADDPAAQADAAVRAIAAFDGRFAADEITVGVVDERLTSSLEQRLNECGLHTRYGGGTPLSRTPPLRLLNAVVEFLEERRYTGLAALVRHPEVAAWLDREIKGDWLTPLDEYYARHLPRDFQGSWFANDRRSAVLRKLDAAITRLLAGLEGVELPWNEWGQSIADLLVRVFAADGKLDAQRERDRQIVETCDLIVDCLKNHASMHPKLAPRVSAGVAISLLLRDLGSASLPARADPQAVELLGWLELVLDDAPALVLTGFNEELVPTSRGGDLFLPNDLRRELGLDDNDDCFARDAYALAAIAASRQQLRVIFGRRTSDGDPLTPSRLLLATDDATLARRALRWFSPSEATPRLSLPASLQPGRAQADFPIPRPQPLKSPVTEMSVTEFRDYLACPYRYYLRHRLDLAAMDDQAEELDDGQFGSLVHDVLEAFAASEVAASTVSDEIQTMLSDELDQLVLERYGKHPMATVMVQVEQARRRLWSFAGWQAKWADGGWRIKYAEEALRKIEPKPSLIVDGVPMILTGRVDRLDYNEQSGEWALLDYKTGDAGRGPEKTHRSGGEWIDLQLPLYRHFIRPLNLVDGANLPAKVKLGYITLPKSLGNVEVQFGNWTVDELAAADRKAEEVVRAVRSEVFWPPADIPPAFSEDYAAICHDGQFGVAIAHEQEAEVGA